jgi:hypothetical protein
LELALHALIKALIDLVSKEADKEVELCLLVSLCLAPELLRANLRQQLLPIVLELYPVLLSLFPS